MQREQSSESLTDPTPLTEKPSHGPVEETPKSIKIIYGKCWSQHQISENLYFASTNENISS